MRHEVSQDPQRFRSEVLALNNDNTPHVNALSEEALDALIAQAASFRVMTNQDKTLSGFCLLYTSPSPRDGLLSRMPSSA